MGCTNASRFQETAAKFIVDRDPGAVESKSYVQ
jgi:hypothetical protein